MSMSLIILKVNYGAIDSETASFQGYYIINFSLSPYTLQYNMNIGVQVIYSG